MNDDYDNSKDDNNILIKIYDELIVKIKESDSNRHSISLRDYSLHLMDENGVRSIGSVPMWYLIECAFDSVKSRSKDVHDNK